MSTLTAHDKFISVFALAAVCFGAGAVTSESTPAPSHNSSATSKSASHEVPDWTIAPCTWWADTAQPVLPAYTVQNVCMTDDGTLSYAAAPTLPAPVIPTPSPEQSATPQSAAVPAPRVSHKAVPVAVSATPTIPTPQTADSAPAAAPTETPKPSAAPVSETSYSADSPELCQDGWVLAEDYSCVNPHFYDAAGQ